MFQFYFFTLCFLCRQTTVSVVECSQSHFSLLVFLDIPDMSHTSAFFTNSVTASAVCCSPINSLKGLYKAVLFSTASLDVKLSNHQVLLSTGKIVIENMTNLNQLIDKKFEFIGFPLKTKDGNGSPIRAAELLE